MKKFLIPVGLLLLTQIAFAEQNAAEKTEPAKATGTAAAKTGQKPAAAPGVKADERVKTALDRLKVKYIVDERGTYSLIFNIDQRRQSVFVNSTTQEFNGMEIRLVTSTAFRVNGALPGEKANALLIDNNKRKLGGWRIVQKEGVSYIVYVVQINANADDAIYRTAIAAAMQSADALEKEETGKDEY